jgi:hypothetical protein
MGSFVRSPARSRFLRWRGWSGSLTFSGGLTFFGLVALAVLVMPAILSLADLPGIPAARQARADRLAEAAGLPRLVRTNQRTFAIPFRLPESRDPDADAAPQRVLLNVSKDLGGTWSAAGETAPATGSFTYTADVDGEYWFRLRAVDRKGRSRGGEGPDIRVLVDAAGPRLAARVWKGADGEIICRYAAADDSLRLDTLVVEYRGGNEKVWKSVAADAVLAREQPAHMVGETIWWAGEKVDQLAVRITISDTAGNQTVKQFSLEASDPGIDQSALAVELGLPALPAAPAGRLAADHPDSSDLASGTRSVLSPGQPGDNAAGANAAWPAESAAWRDGGGGFANSRGSVLEAPPAELPRRRPATAAGLLPQAGRHAARQDSQAADPLAAAGISRPAAAGEPFAYRGRPLHLVNTPRFAWDYEIPAVRRTAGPLRAELWTTRDGGVTWQRAAADKDCRSPIVVELPQAGFYGVRLEVVADVPDADGSPRSGSEPDAWVGLDDEPPQVELVAIDRDETGPDDVLMIRYAARDPLLESRAVRLLYSPTADGPWATIAADLPAQGSHRWEPGRSVPARVFIRVEATDAAGNRGSAVSDDAVSVAPTRFQGRLGGVRTLPPP